MAGDTVDCYNCGNPNPPWAQVCRSCGVPMRAGRTRPSGPVPTDTDSLLSIAAALGAIVVAIVVGIWVSGLIPDAPAVAAEPSPTATADASGTPRPTATPAESEASVEPTPEPTPELIGTVTFGTGITGGREITGITDTFGPGQAFCHSLRLTERFRVSSIYEEVLKVAADGSLEVMQAREDGELGTPPDGRVTGWCGSGTDSLLDGWGPGDFLIRDYRTLDPPELIGEGAFSLTR